MASIYVLGSRLAICTAPGTKKGMYLRRVVIKNTPAQRKARLAVSRIAVKNRGKSPEAVRAAVASGMAGKNFGGPTASERQAIQYQRADATIKRLEASLRG